MAKRKKSSRKFKCARKSTTYDGLTVVLPCKATSLTPAMKAKIDPEYTAAEWNKAVDKECRLVFFTKNKFGIRCAGRKLATSAQKRWAAKGGKKACLKKLGKGKHAKVRFKSC